MNKFLDRPKRSNNKRFFKRARRNDSEHRNVLPVHEDVRGKFDDDNFEKGLLFSGFKDWLIIKKKLVTAWAVALTAVTLLLYSQICIVFTTSESIPYSVCLQVYHLKPEKGDLCAFQFMSTRFLKYIVGTAGDKIRNINGVIYVGLTRVGKATQTNLLTPVEDGVVPDGYVFMAGTHPESFDSRYKEFGLIEISAIRGKAFGVLKYKENQQ